MKKITVQNYRSDKFYPRVVRAVHTILARQDFVAPTEVFVEMNLLSEQAIKEWRAGRLPFLERAIQCNLSICSRILRLLRMHAQDLNLRASSTSYVRRIRSGKQRLRFTKSYDLKLEEAYACHFVKAIHKRKSQDNERNNSPLSLQRSGTMIKRRPEALNKKISTCCVV